MAELLDRPVTYFYCDPGLDGKQAHACGRTFSTAINHRELIDAAGGAIVVNCPPAGSDCHQCPLQSLNRSKYYVIYYLDGFHGRVFIIYWRFQCD